MPHGITQCYLPPGRGVTPAFYPSKAGTRFSYPRGMQEMPTPILGLESCSGAGDFLGGANVLYSAAGGGSSSLALVGDDMTSVGHVNSVDGSTGV